jgi:hypothetical protein
MDIKDICQKKKKNDSIFKINTIKKRRWKQVVNMSSVYVKQNKSKY